MTTNGIPCLEKTLFIDVFIHELRKRMKKLFTFLLICHIASLEPHSLWYILSATTGISDFPEFLASAVVDGVVLAYCDNSLKDTKPKTHWLSKLFEEDPQHMQWLNNKCLLNRLDFKATITTLKQRFNQSEGVHIFQRTNGCFWDDETGEFDGFNEYGYDGEDLIRFDLKTLTWISPRHQTVINKHNWDRDGSSLFWKNALTEDCIHFLKLYLNYGKSFLQTAVRPSVSLLQKTPSSVVTCQATGFYPGRATMFWRKDGQELHEGVETGEILPNNDGTFQMSVDLNISSVTAEDWRRYECICLQHHHQAGQNHDQNKSRFFFWKIHWCCHWSGSAAFSSTGLHFCFCCLEEKPQWVMTSGKATRS